MTFPSTMLQVRQSPERRHFRLEGQRDLCRRGESSKQKQQEAAQSRASPEGGFLLPGTVSSQPASLQGRAPRGKKIPEETQVLRPSGCLEGEASKAPPGSLSPCRGARSSSILPPAPHLDAPTVSPLRTPSQSCRLWVNNLPLSMLHRSGNLIAMKQIPCSLKKGYTVAGGPSY